jgi:hypothetical protein
VFEHNLPAGIFERERTGRGNEKEEEKNYPKITHPA